MAALDHFSNGGDSFLASQGLLEQKLVVAEILRPHDDIATILSFWAVSQFQVVFPIFQKFANFYMAFAHEVIRGKRVLIKNFVSEHILCRSHRVHELLVRPPVRFLVAIVSHSAFPFQAIGFHGESTVGVHFSQETLRVIEKLPPRQSQFERAKHLI